MYDNCEKRFTIKENVEESLLCKNLFELWLL